MIKFSYDKSVDFIKQHEMEYIAPAIENAHKELHEKTGAGSEYTGWVEWPHKYSQEKEFLKIKALAEKVRSNAEVFLVIGIGGSYLGAKAVLDLLSHSFINKLDKKLRNAPEIYFIGQNISTDYLMDLIEIIGEKSLYVNIVSKSGTTLEPALAFRVFRSILEKRYGKDGAKERIIATTDKEKGALKKLADQEGYETLVVPDDIGGRYSVLTPVGLLPIAVGGFSIDEIIAGAKKGYDDYLKKDIFDNPCYQYVAARNILYRKGKSLEIMASYESSFGSFSEWWKQLFGESEGKDQKGIFPASVTFTTDLHSLGQYIQDGFRNLFLTTLWLEKPTRKLEVFNLPGDIDGLNYLTGKTFHEVNEKASQGTILAHVEGGVPNLKISIAEKTPYSLGQLVFFFEKACGISGYLLGVNPFDQPGVEAYKKNMFKLLGKPE